tara:strand:- start:13604 stop:14062 length:459 start_codon:yes stop_codon:yes gene_type:complete
MATGDTYTELGMVVKIATGKPASEDQLGYGALTWVEVGGVVTIPERGDDIEDVSEATLADGRVEHFGGAKDGGVMSVPIKFIEGDAGQAALQAAAGTNNVVSLQEVDVDGEAHFYYGRVFSYRRRDTAPNSFKGYIASIAVNSARFTGTEES